MRSAPGIHGATRPIPRQSRAVPLPTFAPCSTKRAEERPGTLATPSHLPQLALWAVSITQQVRVGTAAKAAGPRGLAALLCRLNLHPWCCISLLRPAKRRSAAGRTGLHLSHKSDEAPACGRLAFQLQIPGCNPIDAPAVPAGRAMRMPRTAVAAAAAALALLLCAGSATAQPSADCHSNFTAGTWWMNMEGEVLKQVENITHAIAKHYNELASESTAADSGRETDASLDITHSPVSG